MKMYFEKMFPYEAWANQKVIAVLNPNDQKSLDLMMHIQAAKHVWLSRIMDTKRELSPFPTGDLEQIKHWNEKNNTDFENWLKNIDGKELSRAIDSINGQRQKYSSKIEDIMLQLMNHSTYHRAQIAVHMKQQNLQPAATDYLLYNQWISNQ